MRSLQEQVRTADEAGDVANTEKTKTHKLLTAERGECKEGGTWQVHRRICLGMYVCTVAGILI